MGEETPRTPHVIFQEMIVTRLTFYGAVRTVTGSMHLVESGNRRILLDCGLYQGRREEAFKRNRHFPFDPASITDVVLSHAHIDHSGNLPTLVRKGFTGRIHATHATRDLCAVMLLDSAHIQESEVQFVNRRRARKGEAPFNPLYTMADAYRAVDRFSSYGYHQPFAIGDVTVEYSDAGHILGSACVTLTLNGDGQKRRLAFSGDLGRKNLPILRDPEPLQGIDWLICESTYGNRLHHPATEVENRVAEVVNATYRQRGKLIIPAFSVGRTQEIVFTLHRLADEGRIPRLPIYVDSPLSANATDVFRMHPECYDEETLVYVHNDKDPFGFRQLQYTHTVEESIALNGRTDPMIIISASGMCETGRILHHLHNTIENSRNTVMIVGFQADHTLGKKLVDRLPEVRIFGDVHQVRANVVVINAFSGHADWSELAEWYESIGPGLRTTYLVHGNEDAIAGMADHLRERTQGEIVVPAQGQAFVVN